MSDATGRGTAGSQELAFEAPLTLYPSPTTEFAEEPEYIDESFGKPAIRNVLVPTLTPIFPSGGDATGAAVIVAPGGGFQFLFAESEGYEVARRLAARDVTAFVLKYRVEPSPSDPLKADRIIARRLQYLGDIDKRFSLVTEAEAAAIEDGAAAVRLVRENAERWQIDPSRVGFLGFAAGGLIACGLTDAPERSRPDFLGIIYAFLRRDIPASAPPAFIAAAADDHLLEDRPIRMYQAWLAANRPAELHLYETGGHDFASKDSAPCSRHWIDAFVSWIRSRRMDNGPVR
ncbi:hypothetical protein GCM10011371_33120 [Novosphingobium marinum]|uniref:Acetyl esterase/lipase n=1 Tax=Novosphingobium marinum TaxID=1514948 RepID=A0A7Y9XYR7_9SPHN|nr:alpha/beta hydrolase fold domain-containing protein [Novosphingobium marinum]NYH97037.1 acetyl esterase/lipase [Novosphingobium marinum]GGC43062.1 hypothetical protein GCM10011371_33120 [Novosphingobium marinum]